MLPTLHDFQTDAVTKAITSVAKDTPDPALLMVAPTGVGKTVMQSAILVNAHDQHNLRGLQVVPTMEIAEGFSRWLGVPHDREALEEVGVYTAKRLANVLAAGEIDPSKFDFVQMDEAHHSVDDTHKAIDLYMGGKPRLGWTATDYRGTPQETAKLHVWWAGNIHRVITEQEAVVRGFASAPVVDVWPLVDDETVSLSKGEFSTVGIEAATEDKLEELVQTVGKKFWKPTDRLWDRPTMLTLTTKYLVEEAMKWFDHFGLPAVAITGETDGRQGIFNEVVARKALLVQIKVVGEGVDLPLRRLIDAAPTMSPVFWRQRIGRIMRPVNGKYRCPLCHAPLKDDRCCIDGHGCKAQAEPPPEYIVTNHNLMRHGYLLHGVLPPLAFRQAKQAWGPDFQPSKRMVARAAGLEGLGRFVPNEVPLSDGSFHWMFVLGSKDGTKQYCSVVNPAGGDPVCAVRNFEIDRSEGTNRKRWELEPTWRRIKKLPDLEGYLSVPPRPLTPPMVKWWKTGAAIKGLDHTAEVNARNFQILPLLKDIGGKFREGGVLR